MKRPVNTLPGSADSPQISEPLLRLISHSDPRDLSDSPSLITTVERFQRRFAQRLTNNLRIAEAVIHDALLAEGYSEPAARAAVDRFVRQIARSIAAFQREVESGTIAAEAVEQVQAELENVQPLLPGGEA